MNENTNVSQVTGMTVAVREQTRIRVNFKISAKGDFQPDITSEAETVETAIANLDKAHEQLIAWARDQNLIRD
jgi:hypothetical protein